MSILDSLVNEVSGQYDRFVGQVGSAFKIPGSIGGKKVDGAKNADFDFRNYASMVANGSMRPKQKYLFRVKFEMYPEIEAQLSTLGVIDPKDVLRKSSFVVKNVSIPSLSREYQEVNYYNYRESVPVKNVHDAINMVMYDDATNYSSVVGLFTFLLTMPSLRSEILGGKRPSDTSFSFDKSNNTSSFDLPHVSNHNVFRRAVIERFYYAPDSTKSANECWKLDRFILSNPKFESVKYEDMAPDSSELATIAYVVRYDTVAIAIGAHITTTETHSIGVGDLLDGISGKGGDSQVSGGGIMRGAITGGVRGTSYFEEKSGGEGGASEAKKIGFRGLPGAIFKGVADEVGSGIRSKITGLQSAIQGSIVTGIGKATGGVSSMVKTAISDAGGITGVKK